MTVQPTDRSAGAMWSPDPIRQKPARYAAYAAAGVGHFWRIEQEPVHVFAYELTGEAYKLVADATEELVLDAPFPIRLSIRDIAP